MVLLGPGITPRRNPSTGAAGDGHGRDLPVLPRREKAPDPGVENVTGDHLLEVDQHLGHPEEAHQHGYEADPVVKIRDAEGEPVNAGNIDSDHPDKQADDGDDKGLEQGPGTEIAQDREAEQHDREDLGRAELQGDLRHRGSNEHQEKDSERPGDKGTESRDSQGRSRPPLPGHLIPVDAGDGRRGLPGDVDQDRRGRAAVHGPVKNAGQHDDRRGRGDGKGDRQEERDGRGGSDPRQDADQGADQTAEQAQGQIDGRDGDAEPGNDVLEYFHILNSYERPGHGDLEPDLEQEIRGDRRETGENDADPPAVFSQKPG